MTNVSNSSLMYNGEIKEKFLNTLSEVTEPSYRRMLLFTSDLERALNKDVGEFNKEEIERVLRSFKANNRNTIESYARIISSYNNWRIENGIANYNVLSKFNPTDFDNYIYDNSDYINDSELVRIENLCANYQDAIIVRLLYLGVGGRGLSELRNLKISDIDFEKGKIMLINSLSEDDRGYPIQYTQRYIEADERSLQMIRNAYNQRLYMKNNGEISQTENENIRPYTDLAINNYIIRPSVTKLDDHGSPVDKFVIYRRLRVIRGSLGMSEDFSSKYIQRSGMLKYASDIYNGREITINDLKIIADRFNIKTHHNLKGFITVENIKRIYR